MTIDAALYENTLIRCRLLTERLRSIATADTDTPNVLKGMASEILTWGPSEEDLLNQLRELQNALYSKRMNDHCVIPVLGFNRKE